MKGDHVGLIIFLWNFVWYVKYAVSYIHIECDRKYGLSVIPDRYIFSKYSFSVLIKD